MRCRATYGPTFHDKLWALAACDADEGCIAVMKVGQEGYERCESVHNADRRDACGSGDFEDGRGYHATHVCGQLGGYKPMRNRAAHGFFAFFSCLSAVLGVAAVCAPAWAPEVEPRRTATLSLSLFGVLPCCVFTLIGFAILSAWYGHGRPGEGACNPDLPAAGGEPRAGAAARAGGRGAQPGAAGGVSPVSADRRSSRSPSLASGPRRVSPCGSARAAARGCLCPLTKISAHVRTFTHRSRVPR